MKSTEIKKEADKIVKSIFKGLLVSQDKESWKKGLDFISEVISKEKAKKYASINDNSIDFEEITRKIWIWERVRFNLSKEFGKRFIKKV